MANKCKQCGCTLKKENTYFKALDPVSDLPICDGCYDKLHKYDDEEREEREFRDRYGYYYG